jgi:hypothetical protein
MGMPFTWAYPDSINRVQNWFTLYSGGKAAGKDGSADAAGCRNAAGLGIAAVGYSWQREKVRKSCARRLI